jgi:hypothetical protein
MTRMDALGIDFSIYSVLANLPNSLRAALA